MKIFQNIFKYKIYIIYIIITFFLFSACASTKKVKEIGEIRNLPVINKGLDNISIKGSFTSSFRGQSQSAECKLLLAKSDSLSLTIFGPMGMTLARLFAKPDYFLFYNAFNNEAIEGTPSQQNLQRVASLPLNYYDFILLSRYEIISNPNYFELQSNFKDENSILFQNSKNPEYIEYYLVAKEDATIKQYQRKLRNGNLILNVFYHDIVDKNGFYFPDKIDFSFPTIDAALSIDCRDVEFNETFVQPFSIKLTESIKKTKLDE